MKTRKEILQELEAVRNDIAGQATMGNPAALAIQAGANAPVIATALGLLLEVALDIRETVQDLQEACKRGAAMIEEHAPFDSAEEGIPVIEIGNEERIAELLAEGKLPGFEEPQSCPKCDTRMNTTERRGALTGWLCPKCQFRLTRNTVDKEKAADDGES